MIHYNIVSSCIILYHNPVRRGYRDGARKSEGDGVRGGRGGGRDGGGSRPSSAMCAVARPYGRAFFFNSLHFPTTIHYYPKRIFTSKR